MTEPRFSNREEFARWLEDKPSEWARVLALRAALRVAPLALDLGFIKEQALLSRLTGALQRAFSVGWGFAKIGPQTW